MTPEQELQRLHRERAAIAERIGVDPESPLAIIGALDKWKGEHDAAIERAQAAEAMLRRVLNALDAIGAPKTGPCDLMINETGQRTLRADERVLAMGPTHNTLEPTP